jgi:DNA recombination-dependent growth factor C
MGAYKGTLTYTTYFVMNEPESGFKEKFIESLVAHRFRDIDVEVGKDKAFGWVSIEDPFDTQFSWASVFLDPYVCVALREDTIRVPPATLKAYLRRRELEVMEVQGKETLSRSERTFIKQETLQQLRRRALPVIKTYDMVWKPREGTLRFWSHNRRINEFFVEFVYKSWGLRLRPLSPYTLCSQDDKGDSALQLAPANYVGASA